MALIFATELVGETIRVAYAEEEDIRVIYILTRIGDGSYRIFAAVEDAYGDRDIGTASVTAAGDAEAAAMLDAIAVSVVTPVTLSYVLEDMKE